MVERSNKPEKEYDALSAYQLVSGAMDGMPFEMDKAYADAQTDSEDKQRTVTATRGRIEDVGSIGSGSAPDGESRILAMR